MLIYESMILYFTHCIMTNAWKIPTDVDRMKKCGNSRGPGAISHTVKIRPRSHLNKLTKIISPELMSWTASAADSEKGVLVFKTEESITYQHQY